ncbi:MAG: hypothetical protein JWM71_857 [Solirubrobacteraceae bacterium]|nr:hypothetical protein [Solirubrobacteraceae bacterium]
MYAERLLVPWAGSVRELIGGDTLFDAHVHIGLSDPAGFQATSDEAVDALSLAQSRGLVFALKEPAGYREANAAMIELAAEHPGQLHALCRLDPADDPLAEVERCLDAGAVGLKLHPRGDAFALIDDRLDAVFAVAHERRLPIMVHGGAGDAEVVDHVIERAEAHPEARLILAHCGIGGFRKAITAARRLPNVYFDTAWWNPSDVWALLRLAPPGRILFASDVPFAGPGACQILTGRLALEAGLGVQQVRSIMGQQLERLVSAADPLEAGEPGTTQVEPLDPELERLYVTLCTIVEPMLRGAPAGQGMELARSTCQERADGRHAELLASISKLLELAEAEAERDALRPLRTPGFDLVLSAAVLARTPSVAVPDTV